MALRADDVDLGRDRNLVERWQAGDPSAFDDLYRRYFDRLHRYCLRLTNDRHEAEEIAQDAFVRAYKAMPTLTGERRFYPWMTVIAKRLVIDRHRKLSRVEVVDEPEMGSVEPDIDHLFDAVDLEHLRSAMGNLGPRHRHVLELREHERLSYAEIARRLDVPVTTVEALLHRARKALRREYAAVGGTGRGLHGLPILGWIAGKATWARLRAHEYWVELAAVAAPTAVAAVTAAAIVLPNAGAHDAPVEAAAPVAGTVDVTLGVDEAPADSPVTAPPFAAPDLADTSPTSFAAPTTAPPAAPDPAPRTDVGPIDLYVGEQGHEEARKRAEDSPTSTGVGPTATGADLGQVLGDTLELIDGADRSAADRADGADGADEDDDGGLAALLGGNP